MKHTNHYIYWVARVFHAILEKTVKPEYLEEAAQYFHCRPEDLPDNKWTSIDREIHPFEGYIRYDGNCNWFISSSLTEEKAYWQAVHVDPYVMLGYPQIFEEVLHQPDGIAKNKYSLLLSVTAVDSDAAWSNEEETVGGEVPTVEIAVERKVWDFLNWAEDDLYVMRKLVASLPGMEYKPDPSEPCMPPEIATAVKRFLSNPDFADQVIRFLGYIASAKLFYWWEPMECKHGELLYTYRSRGCNSFDSDDDYYALINFLDLMGDALGLGENSVPRQHLQGWQVFLTMWGVWTNSTVWSDITEVPLIQRLVDLPPDIEITPRFLSWFMTEEERNAFVQELLTTANKRLDRHRNKLLMQLKDKKCETFREMLLRNIAEYQHSELSDVHILEQIGTFLDSNP